jgi:hypothetical protein
VVYELIKLLKNAFYPTTHRSSPCPEFRRGAAPIAIYDLSSLTRAGLALGPRGRRTVVGGSSERNGCSLTGKGKTPASSRPFSSLTGAVCVVVSLTSRASGAPLPSLTALGGRLFLWISLACTLLHW